MKRHYDLAIVGAGVTGTSLFYALSRFSNIRSIALLEKNNGVALVNSHPLNNAQTSHDGGTETNYDLEHALQVQEAAKLLRGYITRRKTDGLFKKTLRMVLAVGTDQVKALEDRYTQFRDYYPDLRIAYEDELSVIEPKVMEGRNPEEKICALVSSEGFAVNYQILAECFVADGLPSLKGDLFLATAVIDVRKAEDGYVIETNRGEFHARVVVFAAGAYSLLFAQKLGYGYEYGILSVAGDFYSVGLQVYNKVYRPQVEGRPFAELHMDPDVLKMQENHFGPTTVPQPLMERYNYRSFFDYMKLPTASLRGIAVMFYILFANRLFGYVSRNLIYRFPIVGKFLLLKEARKIVPGIRYRDIKRREGAGGIRPQIVNLKTWKLEMGDKTIIGDSCIFNTTPSPGASVCLYNARRDALKVVEFLGEGYNFNQDAFEHSLGLIPEVVNSGPEA